ncbi:DUF447 domain-containing protein [Methanocrinis sp.]|uniref:DUF447 domain-containing protein n=1 Tax=Methanocrinis sp. TaxID=3101522 RepID=UPI003D0BFA08
MMIYDLEEIEELGIFDGINEIIATTENKLGAFNAAPLGLIRRGDVLSVRLFAGSHTYENIMSKGKFVANVSHDPMLFVETALNDIPEDKFVERDGELTLKEAEAWALFKCEPKNLDIALPEVEFVKGEVLEREFRAVNRGINLVVEAAVAATRYVALKSDLYLEEIFRIRRIVGRCGGPREIEAMDRLDELIERFD